MKMNVFCFINTIPVSVSGGVLFIFVLMIMSGMGWGGAQSHRRHADNKVIKERVIIYHIYTISSQFTLEAESEYNI